MYVFVLLRKDEVQAYDRNDSLFSMIVNEHLNAWN